MSLQLFETNIISIDGVEDKTIASSILDNLSLKVCDQQSSGLDNEA